MHDRAPPPRRARARSRHTRAQRCASLDRTTIAPRRARPCAGLSPSALSTVEVAVGARCRPVRCSRRPRTQLPRTHTETQKAKLTTRDATWCQLQLSRQSSPCTVHAKCESARTGAPSEFVTATDCEKTRNSLTVASYLVFCILGRRLPALFQVAFCRCPYGARRRNMGKSMQFVSKRGRNAQRHQGTRESVEDG